MLRLVRVRDAIAFARSTPDRRSRDSFLGNSAGKNKNNMNNQLIELDTSGLQEINGGIAWGISVWGLVVLGISNWAELKKGFMAGWEEQQSQSPYRP